MELFKKQAPDIDIVITTALIPGKKAPNLWPKDLVELMKPGSVIVDLAAEQGGNCELTKPNKIIETKNKVKIVGYTDFPSRMSTQSSNLYSTNIRHMLDDLTPEKNGYININMNDDVIRSATVMLNGELTYPPPPPKITAISNNSSSQLQKSSEEIEKEDIQKRKLQGRNQLRSWHSLDEYDSEIQKTRNSIPRSRCRN